jgi:signal transduction histidine kinase/CheY-like chemotaxis protein
MVLASLCSAVATWDIGGRIRTITASQVAVIASSERLQRFGEALVSASALAVATGDPAHVERYRLIQPRLRAEMGTLRSSIKLPANAREAGEVDTADVQATRIEQAALNLVLAGRRDDAKRLLQGREYKRWADQYFNGLQQIESRSLAYLSQSRRDLSGVLMIDVLLSLMGLPIAALAWFLLVRPSRRWGEELEEARALAQSSAVAKSDFLAAMSHEIRTPLNSIIGFTDILLEDTGLNPTQKRQVSLVQNSGQALLTVVNDILDFSKFEAGKVDLHLEPFAIDALLDNTVSITRNDAETKGLRLEVHRSPAMARYYHGDEHRLRQILLNLINNAIKFTESGSVSVRAEVADAGSEADLLRFTVADTGAGIAQDKQHRLFQHFSQADSAITRRYGGSGLGLAISKRLVEGMGGTIGVESAEGKGSTFWFEASLPRSEAPVLAAPAAPPAAGRASRILLVEDVPVNRELGCAILQRAGHQVETANDGVEAVAAVKARHYDLVLMDIQMPKMDGITATRLIRALPPPQGRVPIVAMTANVLPDQVKQFMQTGMDGHVGKPINQQQLRSAIGKILDRAPPPEAQTGAAGQEPSFDAEAYANTSAILPPERLRVHLGNFDRQLEAVFANGQPAEGLEQAAHSLVSQAGMLGFTQLSERCRELEQNCRDGGDASASLARAGAAAVEARRQVAELLSAL